MALSYKDRQEEVNWFESDELSRTFRGNKNAILEAAKPFTLNHYRIQDTLAKTTMYQALAGKESWEPVVDALDDLSSHVFENPRKYCAPPEISQDWTVFRLEALGYAPNTWWFGTLQLDEIGVSASSWQTQLSRDTTPRKWPEIRERVLAWRESVLRGLDAWEYRASINSYHRKRLAQTWVKDAYDQWGRAVAIDVLKIATRALSSGSHRFDPADPDRAMYDWNETALLRHERTDYDALLNDWIDAGFPDYVEDTPREGWTETKAEVWEWATEDVRHAYNVLTEFEFEYSWSSIDRDMSMDRKPLRKQVWFTASRAEADEEVRTYRTVKMVPDKNSTYGQRRKDETLEYVLRWRRVDSRDISLNEGRNIALLKAGADYENVSAESFLKESHPPIEVPESNVGRLPGDYTRA